MRLNIDVTYIAVKSETVSKEAVYIAVGIRKNGSKEVLTYTILSNRIGLRMTGAVAGCEREWCRRSLVVYIRWIKGCCGSN
ncbi:hypothetical protein E2R60_00555 [Paenibacillus dendritiformis]|nr:hypothetical protein E2R60_00555 [Paenibacillus dendritiformis]